MAFTGSSGKQPPHATGRVRKQALGAGASILRRLQPIAGQRAGFPQDRPRRVAQAMFEIFEEPGDSMLRGGLRAQGTHQKANGQTCT